MVFTTLQDRRLIVERQPVPGSQFQRVKFNLGEVHLILPPVGKDTINCQGIDIPPEGKRIQITKEIVALIQAGFVRIAHDMSSGDQPSVANPQGVEKGGGLEQGSGAPTPPPEVGRADVFLPNDSREANTLSGLFSTREEISACQDLDRLFKFIEAKTSFPANKNLGLDDTKAVAVRLFEDQT